ncbi:hypothetical protein KLK06_26535 [Nonomuraea sp. NEAU-A123]|nr:hypothetical protein [Nonomuraea sp. NEAU-A123]
MELDPVSVVAPSHDLVLWSRLGPRAGAYLPCLWWQERWQFEYSAHTAAIVLTEDYPIHRVTMDSFPPTNRSYTRSWMGANDRLRKHVLDRLGEGAPLPHLVSWSRVSGTPHEMVAVSGWLCGGDGAWLLRSAGEMADSRLEPAALSGSSNLIGV